MTDSKTVKSGTFDVLLVDPVGAPDESGIRAYNIKLRGIEQELFMRAKKAPQAGLPETGEIKREISKTGKPYYRFYREQKNFNTGDNQAIMEKLEAIHRDLRKALKLETQTTMDAELRHAEAEAKRDQAKLKKLDEVFPVNENEPIDLKDIPF